MLSLYIHLISLLCAGSYIELLVIMFHYLSTFQAINYSGYVRVPVISTFACSIYAKQSSRPVFVYFFLCTVSSMRLY